MRIKKVCEYCGKQFIARKSVTKCCSDDCAKRAYKQRVRDGKILSVQEEAKQTTLETTQLATANGQPLVKELVNIRDLSVITSLSERTLYRLMKDATFPRLQIGKRLVFNKDTVIKYLNDKYGNV